MKPQYAVFTLEGVNPHENLAVEEAALCAVPDGGMWLMMWQNRRTVVIGRNQNAWRECRVAELRQDGGSLARRITGGGAVYHDDGNINFSFICDKKLYDANANNAIVLSALNALGISAQAGGRNDMLLEDGRKFSGHAFHVGKNRALHHGTLLCRANTNDAMRYLTPPAHKLQAKGVSSVRARIGNLCDVRADLTVPMLAEAVIAAFIKKYPDAVKLRSAEGVVDADLVAQATARHKTDAWQLGESPAMTAWLEGRFVFGTLRLGLEVKGGAVTRCVAESDALDAQGVNALAETLVGCQYDADALATRALMANVSPDAHALELAEISRWLKEGV